MLYRSFLAAWFVIQAVFTLPVVMVTLEDMLADDARGWTRFTKSTPRERQDAYLLPFGCLVYSGLCVAGALHTMQALYDEYHAARRLRRAKTQPVAPLPAPVVDGEQ